MRSRVDKDWTEERSVGRRQIDRGVCVYHDMCQDTVEGIKRTCSDNLKYNKESFEKMEETVKVITRRKLDGRIFILFVSTVITIALAVSVLVVPQLFKLTETIVRIDTNQQHLMEELSISPEKK